MALITYDEYKVFASIEGSKADPEVDALILACSNIVENLLGYSYTLGSTIGIVLRAGKQTYFLDNPTASSITAKYTSRSTGVAVDVPDGDLILEPGGMLTVLGINFADYDKLDVTITTTEAIPEEIKLATKLLVRYYKKDEYNRTTVAAGGQQVTYQTGNNLPPHVRTLILQNRVM